MFLFLILVLFNNKNAFAHHIYYTVFGIFLIFEGFLKFLLTESLLLGYNLNLIGCATLYLRHIRQSNAKEGFP
jgi:hypothetical protein